MCVYDVTARLKALSGGKVLTASVDREPSDVGSSSSMSVPESSSVATRSVPSPLVEQLQAPEQLVHRSLPH